MKLILIANPKSAAKNYAFGKVALTLFFAVAVILPLGLGALSYHFNERFDNPDLSKNVATSWKSEIAFKKQELTRLRAESESDIKALTVKLAEVQARLLRLEALGERMVSKTKMGKGEFDFSSRPAVGGLLESVEGESFQRPSFMEEIDQLLVGVEQNERQMLILESILEDKAIEEEVFLAGRPLKKGWMSSFYGRRIDPFSGKLASHKGIDFAGKEGSEVIAVASGVVTWAESRYGYGQLVEIDHGGGYVTRYAHNKEHLVKLGDIVHKGQAVATMGSSGRSTGPHVHFEVLHNGRAVNPERYVYRENR